LAFPRYLIQRISHLSFQFDYSPAVGADRQTVNSACKRAGVCGHLFPQRLRLFVSLFTCGVHITASSCSVLRDVFGALHLAHFISHVPCVSHLGCE